MQVVMSFYSKGYEHPVIVITEQNNVYLIHALVGGGAYFVEGYFTDLNKCIEIAEQKVKAY